MLNWKSRYEARIGLLAVFCTIVGTLLITDKTREFLWELLWQRTWAVPPGLIVAALLLVILFGLYFFIDEIARERDERRKIEQLKDAALDQLRNNELMQQIDVVTRIPNQTKLKADLKIISARMRSGDEYQMIMLDLDSFGKINKRFGYQKGDDVIEYIAQSIYQSMRRNEVVYKRPIAGGIASDDLPRGIYRKYSGGDEFIFVLYGNEAEALGFLLRQTNDFEGKFQRHIEQIIPKETWHLKFRAGICPIYHNDTFEEVIHRVEDCLRKADLEGSKSRVYWHSRRVHSDFPENARDRGVYLSAEKRFALPP